MKSVTKFHITLIHSFYVTPLTNQIHTCKLSSFAVLLEFI